MPSSDPNLSTTIRDFSLIPGHLSAPRCHSEAVQGREVPQLERPIIVDDGELFTIGRELHGHPARRGREGTQRLAGLCVVDTDDALRFRVPLSQVAINVDCPTGDDGETAAVV